MNNDNLIDLPEWLDDFNDEEGEELYAQWREIVFLLNGIVELALDSKNEMLICAAKQVINDAYVVGVKIRSSEAGNIYILKMENAAIIRQLAQGIPSALLLLTEDSIIDQPYIQVLRSEINKFRKLYVEWISTFEKDDIVDEWGLFI